MNTRISLSLAVGEAINREFHEQIRRHQAELKVVQEQVEQASEGKDEETRQELEEEMKKLEEQIEKIKKDSEGMALDYSAEKERMETKLKKWNGRQRRREWVEAEYHRQSIDTIPLSQVTADRPGLERGIEALQDQLDDSGDSGWVTISIYK